MKNFILFSLFLLSFSISAQQRFIDNSFDLKKTETNIYATKNGEELKLDIYQPGNDTLHQRPLIIFMHGGGFAGGTRTNQAEVKFAETAAKKGYVAVQISYRLTRKGQSFGCDYEASGKIKTFKLAAEDFMDAVSFMVQNKEKFRIDPSKIIVGGSSAGAEAVLNAVYNDRLMFPDATKYKKIDFSGVFSLAGAVVDARYIVEENAIPGVFFHGTEDNLVPYGTAPHHWCDANQPGYIMLDGSKTITEKLAKLNTSYMLYSFEGGKHEHSGMPFKYFPEVFKFFNSVFLNNEKQQIEIWK
ncbi:MAG TPA: alpha/beta hydrolase fold domain-containing protein [Salegentibacter sp.]|uniref:alpha/beta hydrolase n=1 Tax=Salegentibacter sp. TaxID=1903072 RepID=UPI002F94B73E